MPVNLTFKGSKILIILQLIPSKLTFKSCIYYFVERYADITLDLVVQNFTSRTFSVFSTKGNVSVSKINSECVSGCDSYYIEVNTISNDPGGWIRISSLQPGTLYEMKIINALFSDYYAPKTVNFTFNFTTGNWIFSKARLLILGFVKD